MGPRQSCRWSRRSPESSAIALRSIRYGTIELVIHDGRVVQLERREKVRFEQDDRGGRR